MFTLSEIKNSLNKGYLPEDWADRIRNGETLERTYYGFAALNSDTTETAEGNAFHTEINESLFFYDEIDEEFKTGDAVHALGKRGRRVYTSEDNCIYFDGEHYIENYLSDNDIVVLHNGDYCHLNDARYVREESEYYHENDVYYWASDGDYHLEEENNVNVLWGYQDGPREKCFLSDAAPAGFDVFGWGVEIEKNAMPDFDFDRQELYDRTGAVMEQDSSVDEGFELKTPVYNLFSSKTIERLEALKEFCNIDNNKNAGGHIGFSMDGKNDEELLNLCRGFLPLIYAMHKKRIGNDYCKAKKIKELMNDGSKYQSIRLRGNYIEFRIFSAVRSFDSLMFRLELFRIIARNLGANFAKVLLMASNNKSPLFELLGRVYDTEEKMNRLLTDAIAMNADFGEERLTPAAIAKITARLQKSFGK